MIAALLTALLLLQDSGGVVSGQIRGVDNTPAAGVLVAAMRHPDPNSPGVTALIRLTETDPSGRYQLDKIPPGQYDIVAGPRLAPTYFPGTPLPALASTLTIVSGSRLENISFRMTELRISGRVTETATDRPAVGAQVSLRSNTGSSPDRESVVKPDGTFEFRGLAPGIYNLESRYDHFRPVRKSITISDRNVDQVAFQFDVARLTGRLTGDGNSRIPTTESPGAIAAAIGANGEILQAILPIQSNGTFDFRVDADDYAITLYSLLGDYYVRSIRLGDRDLLQEKLHLVAGTTADIRITVGPRPQPGESKVTGRVRDALSSGPSTADKVTLCCVDGPVRRLFAPIRSDGAFEFLGVPSGTYQVGIEGKTDFWPIHQLVNVSGRDISGVSLVSEPYVLRVEGTITPEKGATIRFVGAQTTAISPSDNGAFAGTLPEGEYHVCVETARNDSVVRSITSGSTNLLSEPLKMDGHALPPIIITLAARTTGSFEFQKMPADCYTAKVETTL